jgi:hypothetical protein
VLNHPSAKMEFNYKRNLIKEILNKIEKFHPNCKCINLKEVKAFVSNKKELQEEKKIETRIFYEERSNGTFKNNTKNERLHTLFEEIRKEIEKNND